MDRYCSEFEMLHAIRDCDRDRFVFHESQQHNNTCTFYAFTLLHTSSNRKKTMPTNANRLQFSVFSISYILNGNAMQCNANTNHVYVSLGKRTFAKMKNKNKRERDRRVNETAGC